MNFLAPLFLLGALAVVAPVVFHLIRRTSREKTEFSTLMFLRPTPPRVTRRSRLENVWLLLLRCVVLALLALGFARPFLRQDGPVTPGSTAVKRTVLLVDVSASMRRPGAWPAALALVAARLRDAGPADECALVVFDRSARVLVSFEDWRALGPDPGSVASQRLAGLEPGWAATHLDTALLFAADLLAGEVGDLPVQPVIVVISDLQEGARLDGAQGRDWPRGLVVTLDPVRLKPRANAGLTWVPPGEAATGDEIRVRVTNGTPAKTEQFHLRWQDGESAEVYVPAGQARTVTLPRHAGGESLTLEGDEEPFDNRVFIVPPEPVAQSLLFLGRDEPNNPRQSLYYLRRAFPPTRQQTVEVIVHRGAEPVPAFQLEAAQLAVLGEEPSEAALASARQFARGGRLVLAALTDTASAGAVGRLLDQPGFAAAEAAVGDYALLAQIDFQHPLFSPFADPRFSDFTKIHFWRYRRIDPATTPGAQLLARFDRGDPALVQIPLGQGAVLLLTTSWRPVDSQLALSSKFVPLLHAALDLSSRQPAVRAQYAVGDEVPVRPQAASVRKPDGTEIVVESGGRFAATDLPGVYLGTPGPTRFAVNLAPEESQLAPLDPARLTAFGVPLTSPVGATPASRALDPRAAQAAELESRQKLWRWLVLASLVFVALETLLAARLSRATTAA